jgi:hypothetical protein
VNRDDVLELTLANTLCMSSVSQKNLQGNMKLRDFITLGDTIMKVNKAFTDGGKDEEDKVRAAVEREYVKSLSKLHRTKLLKETLDEEFAKVTG